MSIEPVTGKEWQELSSDEQAVTPVLLCKGCGRTGLGDEVAQDRRIGAFPFENCWACPPRLCAACGQMDSVAKNCPCWASESEMPEAEFAAILFGRDGKFSIALDGTLNRR